MSTIELRTNIAFFGLDRIQADFDGNLGSVLPQAEQLAADAHRAGLGILEEHRAKAGMPLPEALGHQHLDRAPQEFLARIAEEPLDLAIDQDDRAVLVDHQEAARRRLDRRPQSQLDRAARFRRHEMLNTRANRTMQRCRRLRCVLGVQPASRTGPGSSAVHRPSPYTITSSQSSSSTTALSATVMSGSLVSTRTRCEAAVLCGF